MISKVMPLSSLATKAGNTVIRPGSPTVQPGRDAFVRQSAATSFGTSGKSDTVSVPNVEIPLTILGNIARPDEWKRFGHKVGDALRQHGFIAVSYHGVDKTNLALLNRSAEQAFDLPEATKKHYQHMTYGWQRGWNPPNRNNKEIWNFGETSNLFPTEVEGFGRSARPYYGGMKKLAEVLVKALDYDYEANGRLFDLVVDPTTGKSIGTHMVTINHNRPQTADKLAGLQTAPKDPSLIIRHAAHSDWELMTLIGNPMQRGLQIKRPGTDEWAYVDAPPDSILVNTGNMMASITERSTKPLPAAQHRVVGTAADMASGRMSVAFFVSPHYEHVLPQLGTPGPVMKDGTVITAGRALFSPSKALKDAPPGDSRVQAEYEAWMANLKPLIDRV